MKIALTKAILALIAAGFIAGGATPSAQAVPINGSIDFSGTAVGTQSGGTSTLTFNNPMIVTSRTGDYAFAGVPIGMPVNWAPISWTGSSGSTTLTPGPQLEWQFAVAGTTFSFTLLAVDFANMNSSMVRFTASGILTMSGAFNRDPTFGAFVVQGTGNNFVFQIGQSVPENGSALLMLGAAAMGLELLRRKLLCVQTLE